MPDQLYIDEARAIGPRPVWQIVPPQDFRDRMANDKGAATPPGGYPLTDHGGSTLHAPKLVIVYLGPWWGDRARLEQFARELMTFGYLAPLSGYGSGPGTFLGAFSGTSLPPGATFTRQQLETVLADCIAGKNPVPGLPQPDGNTLYALLLPSGFTVTDGASASCTAFCGFHDAFDTPQGTAFYTVQPATDCNGCHQDDPFSAFTMVLGHEIAEACTDAVPGKGWFNDATGMENADEWAWIPKAWGPWIVQGYQTNESGNTVGAYAPPVPKPQPLSVTITSSPHQPAIAQPIAFGVAVIPSVSPAATFLWDFGDTGAGSTLPGPTHSYGIAGAYTVQVTINDGAQMGHGSLSIAIAETPPPQTTTDPFWSWLVQDAQWCLTEPETARKPQAEAVRSVLDRFYPPAPAPAPHVAPAPPDAPIVSLVSPSLAGKGPGDRS